MADQVTLGARPRFPAVDIVRLLAAILVAVYHLGFVMAPRPVAALGLGWVGVEIFFVISGFVIAFSAERQRAGDFAVSRALRLYPIAILASVVILGIRVANGTPLSGQIVPFLRSALIWPVGPWLDNVFWTLPIEAVFYTLVAVSIARRWPLDRVALALGGYSAVYWFAILLNDRLRIAAPVDLSTGKLTLTLLHYGVFFALGMLLHARRHTPAMWLFGGVALVAIVERSLHLSGRGTSVLAAPITWLLAIGLIELSVCANERLQALPTRTVGMMTYPLYLIHSTVGILLFGRVPLPVAVVAGLALSFAAAFAMLPLERRLRRLMERGGRLMVESARVTAVIGRTIALSR